MDVNTIEDYYQMVEESTDKLFKSTDNTPVLKKLETGYTDSTTIRNLRLEQLVMDFNLADGKCLPHFSSTSQDGTVLLEYPSYSLINAEDYAYIKLRASSVVNDFLIGRYNQILWNSPERKIDNAKNAIDAYLRILNQRSVNIFERKSSREALNILENAFGLSLSIKYKVEEFKSIIKRWIFERDSFEPTMRIHLIDHLSEVRQLQKNDFSGVLDFLKNYGLEIFSTSPDSSFPKYVFEIGLRIAERTGEGTKIWYELIGDGWVKMAESRIDDSSRMVPLEFYRSAILSYKKAGNKIKVKQCEETYTQLKKSLKLEGIRLPIEDSHTEVYEKHCKDMVEFAMSLNEIGIYDFLASSELVFPNKIATKKLESNSENAFFKHVTTIVFDINQNITKVGPESDKDSLFRTYGLMMQFRLPVLNMIFIEGIKRGKISFESFIKYLKEHSWLGQNLMDVEHGVQRNNTWLSLIAPSIQNFFQQITYYQNYNEPLNLVMAIDSLTVKIEGILRDFAKYSKISVTTTGREGVLREKYIEELLADPEFITMLDEDNVMFLQYWFTKSGQNLRNNIAHTFFKRENYSPVLMMILICSILKLGYFKITYKNEDSSDSPSPTSEL